MENVFGETPNTAGEDARAPDPDTFAATDFMKLLYSPLRECSGVFSLGRIEVQATQVEKDVVFESFFVPIAKRLFDQPLDFVVETFDGTIG